MKPTTDRAATPKAKPVRLSRYNRETRDFDAYLDGQYIGSFPTSMAAENALNDLAFEQMRRAA